jgi:FdhD protein
MTAIHRELKYTSCSKTGKTRQTGFVAIEIETRLSVNGEDWLGFHCSPDELEYLAAGFLFNEMIIKSKKEISSISVCENLVNIDVWLNHSEIKPQTWSRTSGCLGGVSSINTIKDLNIPSALRVPIDQVRFAVELLLAELKPVGSQINGLHASVMVKNNAIVSKSLDIGRHNTLDKIAGDCLLREVAIGESILATTGRISADMVFKSVRMGAPILISLHSASSLALDLAQELGITLISHAHRPQMAALTGIDRLIFPKSNEK